MDKKILLQNLAENLAERTGLSKRKAEAFVRSFFEITEEALQTDGQIKVKNFGTTKIVNVSQRESVNINTGERFQIDSHAKITFTPDAPFRDLVNRPFAHFTTIILEDEMDEADLDTIAQLPPSDNDEDDNELQQDDADNTDDTEKDYTEDSKAEEDAHTADEPLSPTIEENTAQAAFEEIEDAPSIEEIPAADEDLAGKEEEAFNVAPPIANEEVPTTTAPAEMTSEKKARTTEEEIITVELETAEEENTEQETAEEENTEQETVEEENAEEENVEEENAEEENIEEEKEEASATMNNDATKVPIIINNTLPPPYHNCWRTAFLILIITIVSLASYFAGYYRLFCPCNFFGTEAETITTSETLVADSIARADSIAHADSVARTDSIAKAKTDSIAAVAEKAAQQLEAQQLAAQKATEKLAAQQEAAEKAAARQQELAAAAKYNQLPGGNYLITGVMQTRQVKYGENLYMIARRYYGHKDFARYIIFHNNISDPNLVTVGQRIQLPKLIKR